MSNTIVFIHGMFATPRCWTGWMKFYEDRGYECIAPPWPGRDHEVEKLREQHPDPELAKLSLGQVVRHYEQVITGLDEAPVLIGHSMGGLVVQLLLQKGLGAAGVAINSAPPQWVFSFKWSFIRSNWPIINPLAGSKPYYMPFSHFQYTFVHTLSPEEQRNAYDREVVPESRKVARGSLTGDAHVDFKAGRAPLLMTAGSQDHIIPASLNQTNFKKYRDSPSVTDFQEFPHRTHYIIAQPGWEEVANYVLSWLDKVGAKAP